MSELENARAALRAVGGFAELDAKNLDALIRESASLRFGAGQILMAQGEASDFADILISGEAEICANSVNGPVLVAQAQAPAMVGELGAFAGLARTATVRARTDVAVLRIGKAALVEAAKAAPALLIDAMSRLGERLRKVNGAIGLYTHALAALERGELLPDLMRELRSPIADLVDFGESFTRMANEIVLRRQRNDEMASAAIIQRALLPDPRAFADTTRLDVHAQMSPARDVGGDFFELLELGDGRVALGVGDVCGKGVPAALFMGISKTLLRIGLRERVDLADAVLRANAYLTAHYPADQFATLFYAIYQPTTGALTYLSCGHPPARIRRANGRVEALPAGGLPIGMFEDLRVRPRTARLETGDLLFVYSDGVTEAADPSAREFGERRLDDALAMEEGQACAAIAAVLKAAREFAAGAALSDDVTCVALRR